MKCNRSKVMTILGCCALCLSIAGCQENSIPPKTVTTQFLDAYHELNDEKMKQTSEWSDFNVKTLEIQDKDYVKGVDKGLQKEVYTMMLDFKHKEFDEKIDGDKAHVKVDITVYDFQPVIEQGMKEATKRVEELSKEANVSDAQAQTEISKIIFENMKKAKMDKTKSITVNVVKKNQKWMVSNDNKILKDILSENTKSFMKYS